MRVAAAEDRTGSFKEGTPMSLVYCTRQAIIEAYLGRRLNGRFLSRMSFGPYGRSRCPRAKPQKSFAGGGGVVEITTTLDSPKHDLATILRFSNILISSD
jgi:hypothetical protein